MTQENKELLLQDLCARLPHGVKVDIPDLFISTKTNVEVLNEIFCGDDGEFRCNGSGMLIRYVKPYLFPISSMTEEQKVEYDKMSELDIEYTITQIKNDSLIWTSGLNRFNWFLKNHFDVYGLIPMGLANDATGLNIY